MLVTTIKEVLTKSKGERMVFVGVEDLTGHAEVTFFPRSYAEARELIRAEQPLWSDGSPGQPGRRRPGCG